MTYDASELSFQSGAPVELYEFRRAARVWRFTSSDADVTVDGATYTAAPLQRTAIEQTPERARNGIRISCARDFPIADLFRVTSPTDVISVTIIRYHRAEPLNSITLWMGRVLNAEWRGLSADLSCEPVSASLTRTGLRRLYQKQCPHVLYGAACGVSKVAQGIATTVTAASGVTLTVAALTGGKPYAGGFVEWLLDDGMIERRFITGVASLALTLSQPFQGITVGQAVTVYPGCNHTTGTCSSVYGNLANFGGFPYIPTKNPFDGSPVY